MSTTQPHNQPASQISPSTSSVAAVPHDEQHASAPTDAQQSQSNAACSSATAAQRPQSRQPPSQQLGVQHVPHSSLRYATMPPMHAMMPPPYAQPFPPPMGQPPPHGQQPQPMNYHPLHHGGHPPPFAGMDKFDGL